MSLEISGFERLNVSNVATHCLVLRNYDTEKSGNQEVST